MYTFICLYLYTCICININLHIPNPLLFQGPVARGSCGGATRPSAASNVRICIHKSILIYLYSYLYA